MCPTFAARYRARRGSPSTPPSPTTQPPTGAEHVPGPRRNAGVDGESGGGTGRRAPAPKGDRPRALPAVPSAGSLARAGRFVGLGRRAGQDCAVIRNGAAAIGARLRRRSDSTDVQDAAAYLVSTALLEVRASAYLRRPVLSVDVPATDAGDDIDHMHAVAAATVDLPPLIADPRRTFNRCSLDEWLRLLAEGDDPQASWVRAVLKRGGFDHVLR
jgi:hypothetical protein